MASDDSDCCRCAPPGWGAPPATREAGLAVLEALLGGREPAAAVVSKLGEDAALRR